MQDNWIKVVIAAAVFLFLFILIMMRRGKRQKQRMEEHQNALRRMREDALDKAVLNPKSRAESALGGAGQQRRPFQIRYTAGEESAEMPRKFGKRPSGSMLQVTEISAFSSRKFIYHMEEQLLIGMRLGKISILSPKEEGASVFCIVFFYQGSHYVKSTGKQKIVLERGRKSAVVDGRGLQIQSGDKIRIAKNCYILEYTSA